MVSKITFIESILNSKIISKKERALYKDIESLEEKKLIEYDQKKIRFSEQGLKELQRIEKEVKCFIELNNYFKSVNKTKRKLQTIIN